jgi:hypothetical protein
MSSSVVPYHVSVAYESLLDEFQKAMVDGNCQLFPASVPIQSCFGTLPGGRLIKFELGLYLKGCPCNKLPSKRRLDIEIHAIETLDRTSWNLVKSTVYLNYLVLVGSKLRPIRSVHFDFVAGGQERHPFFHAQLLDEIIKGDSRRFCADIEPRLQLKSTHEWVPSRIPTSDMTLASVLYCIAADHLSEGKFNQFMEQARPIQDKLPKLQFDALTKSLKGSKHFKSSHWFAHNQVQVSGL